MSFSCIIDRPACISIKGIDQSLDRGCVAVSLAKIDWRLGAWTSHWYCVNTTMRQIDKMQNVKVFFFFL